MNVRLDALKAKIDELHTEIEQELAEKREQFRYTIERGKIKFQSVAEIYHRTLRRPAALYVFKAPLAFILTAPIIYSVLPAFILLDALISVYQVICFPVYGIPLVKRSDYLKLDRHKLNYLNIIQKINCEYCSYGNGVLAYASEVAGRTELFWCPIKHAKTPKSFHERYTYFIDYGDADNLEQKMMDRREKCKACDDCGSCEK